MPTKTKQPKKEQPKEKSATTSGAPTVYVCAKCDRRYLQTYPECPVCGGTLNQV